VAYERTSRDESLVVDLVFPYVIGFACRSFVFETITPQCRLPAFVRLLHSKLTFEAFEGSGKTRNFFREVVHFGLYRKQTGFYGIHPSESDARVCDVIVLQTEKVW